MASGEYFLNKDQKKVKQKKEKDEKQAAAAKKREQKRQEAFVAPEETSAPKPSTSGVQIDFAALREKIKKAQKDTKIFNKKN